MRAPADEVFLAVIKEAALPQGLTNFVTRHHGALGGAGAFGGVGALVGGLGGALHGAVSEHRRASEEGDPSTIRRALGGALRGGATGAGAGALIGAGTGAGLGVVRPELAEKARAALTRSGPLGAGARFGQRQVHGLTGWRPRQEEVSSVRDIGLGAHSAAQRLDTARRTGKGVAEAEKAFSAAENAEQMGLTSLPGFVGAVRKHGPRALATGIADAWHGMSPGWRAASVGMSVLPAATLLDSKATREEKARSLASVALSPLNMATGGLPMLMGNAVTGVVNRGVSGAVGALAR